MILYQWLLTSGICAMILYRWLLFSCVIHNWEPYGRSQEINGRNEKPPSRKVGEPHKDSSSQKGCRQLLQKKDSKNINSCQRKDARNANFFCHLILKFVTSAKVSDSQKSWTLFLFVLAAGSPCTTQFLHQKCRSIGRLQLSLRLKQRFLYPFVVRRLLGPCVLSPRLWSPTRRARVGTLRSSSRDLSNIVIRCIRCIFTYFHVYKIHLMFSNIPWGAP